MFSSRNNRNLLVFKKRDRIHLLWCSVRTSTPGVFSVESRDGKKFKKSSSSTFFTSSAGSKIIVGDQSALRANMLGTKTLLTFADTKNGVVFATSERGETWKEIARPTLFQRATVCLRLPTRGGKKGQLIAFSSRSSRVIFQGSTGSDLRRFKDTGDVLEVRRNSFDRTSLSPLATELISQGILLVYSAKNSAGRIVLGAALFDRNHPRILLWRSHESLWEAPKRISSEATLIGGISIGKYFYVYLQSPGKEVEYFPIARLWDAVQQKKWPSIVLPPRKKGTVIRLDRSEANPVLEPLTQHSWEAFATFNPAALVLDGRVHLLYRAQGFSGLSVLGYAASADGIHIDERSIDPVFEPLRAFESGSDTLERKIPMYVSGGGTGGCEDPRLVEIDGVVYLIYIAYDGSHPPGIALTTLSKSSFLKKNWQWTRPKLISQPGRIQKNWVLFPRKIGGKYVILHGLSPKNCLEYVDDLKKLGDGKYVESLSSHGGQGYVEAKRLHAWDNIVRGVGAPPLWTEHGWLVFYHGMDMRDPGKYKVGVMLLDLKNPEIILRRSLEPVLEPETAYENGGHKRGVIYVCGAVIKEKQLFVYYGAADHTSAVAMAPLETFLQALLKEKVPKLRKMNPKKIR